MRFDLKDERSASQFDELVVELLPMIKAKEPRTLVYATHVVDAEPLSRVFYEVYEDRDAFEFHEAQEHTKTFLAERAEHVASLRVEFLSSVDGKGI